MSGLCGDLCVSWALWRQIATSVFRGREVWRQFATFVFSGRLGAYHGHQSHVECYQGVCGCVGVLYEHVRPLAVGTRGSKSHVQKHGRA